MNELFSNIVDLVFTLEDGSELLCKTTLCSEILNNLGLGHVDGFVDLSTNRIIPEDMFEYDFIVKPEGTHKLSALDSFFQLGGKVHWESITFA